MTSYPQMFKETLNLAVIGLATARLTQVVVDDEITRPLRERIQEHAANAEEFTVAERVDTLISCHACTSVWAAAGVLAAGRAGPVGRFLVSVLAASQLALATKAVIERIDR